MKKNTISNAWPRMYICDPIYRADVSNGKDSSYYFIFHVEYAFKKLCYVPFSEIIEGSQYCRVKTVLAATFQ
jgi:hypothetical protein